MRITHEEEKLIISKLLQAAGANLEEAKTVAEVLTEGDLRGFSSHGILRLPYILRAMKRGTIIGNANIRIVKETPATALVDGGHGLGHYVAARGMRIAIEKARSQGVGAVGIFNTNHFGIAGYYAEMAMKEKLIGIVMTTTDALVHPWGGVEPLLGTNALTIGIPTSPPVLLDMAMSVAARGKLVNAMKKGQRIPEGWAIDTEGKPTTDPAEGLKGALSPFGGPKGYALAFVLELLAGPMVGASAGRDVVGTLEPKKGYSTKGDLIITLNPAAFVPMEEFQSRAKKFIDEIKNSRKAPGVHEIMIPGEPEMKAKERALREGIIIAESIWEEIRAFSRELGVTI